MELRGLASGVLVSLEQVTSSAVFRVESHSRLLRPEVPPPLVRAMPDPAAQADAVASSTQLSPAPSGLSSKAPLVYAALAAVRLAGCGRNLHRQP